MGIKFEGARVFITGGAGFVGSHLADRVLEAGAASIVILDDLVRGRRENLSGALATKRVEFVVGDICNAALVDRLTEGVDVVFHQAALRITQCAEQPVRAVQVMANGVQNVLEAAVRHKVKKVVAASSASVYGEPSYLPMDEVHPFNNRTLYGASRSRTSRCCGRTRRCTISTMWSCVPSTSTARGWTSSVSTPK